MLVRNDYDECLTNLACSIRRHFGIACRHKTLGYIDALLDERNPRNIVLILCDGMGPRILDGALDPDDFLMRHRIKTITTVFPATTVAATTSVMTGLNPCETGMLGWDMLYPGLGRVFTTFHDSPQETKGEDADPEAVAYRAAHMTPPTIVDEINAAGVYEGETISPFEGTRYETVDEMFDLIADACRRDGKKYVYAYHVEPDDTMHGCGCRSDEAKAVIRDLSERIERLATQVEDTVIIVTADHGHHDIENVCIDDYPDLRACIEGNLFLEPRAVSMFVRPGMREAFVRRFKRYFGRDFLLVEKEDVITSGLFGDGDENPIFRDALGDYLAIATGNRALVNSFGARLKSHHAGYTDDEIYVPIIVC